MFGLAFWTSFSLWPDKPKAASGPTHIRETRHDSVIEFEKE